MPSFVEIHIKFLIYDEHYTHVQIKNIITYNDIVGDNKIL